MLTPKQSRKIIVNADDFGMSAEANRAIVEAFENNVISSTTLMTNMPGFDEACELAHRRRLLGKIGLRRRKSRLEIRDRLPLAPIEIALNLQHEGVPTPAALDRLVGIPKPFAPLRFRPTINWWCQVEKTP